MILHWWLDGDGDPAPDAEPVTVAIAAEDEAVHAAARRYFPGPLRLLRVADADAVERAVRDGAAEFGLLPTHPTADDLLAVAETDTPDRLVSIIALAPTPATGWSR